MSLITSMRKQTAVYWALGSAESGGVDVDDYGKPKYATPVEIECRWEDVADVFVGPGGSEEVSRSMVYVDRVMRLGEVLMLGSLDSGIDQLDPKANTGAWEIRQLENVPNFKNTETLRIAYL